MIKRTLKQVHEMAAGLNDITPFQSIAIQGVTIDSRTVNQGCLFIPLKGGQVDGHQYVKQALAKGAAASFWQKDVPNPPIDLPIIIVEDTEKALQELARSYRSQLNIKVVGITGSNGKTTTKDMTAALLATTFKVHKTNGNFNNHLGLPLTVLSIEEDTEAAVLEMGMSSRGEIEFLSKMAKPDLAIITNIGESHLLDLGSREEIANAKLEIVEGLSKEGALIYHGDEPLLRNRIKTDFPDLNVISFGRTEQNDLYPQLITQGMDSTTFTIACDETQVEYEIPVLGHHNVLNALAAILVAKEFGVDDSAIHNGLSTIQLTNMRMEMVEGAKGQKIINDAYNASPTSVKAAVELIEGLSGFEKKILVLGDMLELGPQEKDFHLKIGELISGDRIDKVFTYGPLAEYIAKGASQAFTDESVRSFQDKQELIAELESSTQANDIILVKASRGMKLEEVVQALQK
ncbi:UDP-N-acetylmuramoyl-tripeptide--D-alanyl-D-alanine ligase [Peribacillus muralis]|uniref:UDP-N-acetylmuramoyl-tripeptide--D-alanyl-D- alanine ligase n=1 Tax=Peribacillus muralis TaxID=264697 RepID=UPI001F4ECE9E|nr:UDP-N-acetylmuramoyl-tripeptide--D-alanyl-D-alanine ligase [Peribacillus muralis]MCK1995510.1 UDP-N-acetylmuramoyl-tripeptide--D-alanyl-D-alanine ligase [Peribacillus muralis]MCK2016094.1 UDP-N-acetylmuramoyl-tripeptide--D-alanyl-D-alanine ligase [Peribacillus muralis]